MTKSFRTSWNTLHAGSFIDQFNWIYGTINWIGFRYDFFLYSLDFIISDRNSFRTNSHYSETFRNLSVSMRINPRRVFNLQLLQQWNWLDLKLLRWESRWLYAGEYYWETNNKGKSASICWIHQYQEGIGDGGGGTNTGRDAWLKELRRYEETNLPGIVLGSIVCSPQRRNTKARCHCAWRVLFLVYWQTAAPDYRC